jgi:predicted O-methyltransferase YrrM
MVDETQRSLRKSMAFVKEQFKTATITGAEVGVQQGYNALAILEKIPNVQLLYLVDPYLEHPVYGWNRYKFLSQEILSAFNNRIRWIYKKFEECTAKDLPEPLDFIYIDGDHSYECVKQDILLASELVKKSGVVGGHDAGNESVDQAVKEYCESKHVACYFGENEPYLINQKLMSQGWDWWFINT